jgi:hypothetical protein
MHLVATNALTLDVNRATTFNANGTISITVGGTFTVTAPSINLNGVIIDSSGNVTIPGNLTVSGSISGASESISGNTYSGSRTGGPI